MKQQNESAISTAQASLRRNIFAAFIAVGMFFGIGFGWAAYTEISGAVIASGRVAVKSELKRVQHPDGGIVDSIFVQDGDRVKAGDVLVSLDETIVRTNFEINRQRLLEALVLESRLNAELLSEINFPIPRSLAGREDSLAVQRVLASQKRLAEARRDSILGQKNQLREQVKQTENRITGLGEQIAATETRIKLLDEEIENLKRLLKQKLVTASRVSGLKSDRADLVGEKGRLTSELSVARNSISELEIQLIQVDEEHRSKILEQIQTTRAQIAELQETMPSIEQKLSQVEIRAPYAGTVHEMQVHTVGQVVEAGGDLLLIIPEEDELVVEALVRPQDIDQLYVWQKAILRMSGLDARITPELSAKLGYISGELVEDPVTRQKFYQIEVEIDDGELKKLGEQKLVPGMPVDVFVQTTRRKVLTYLVKPLTDQIAHAFRE